MAVERITCLDDPRLSDYATIREPELLRSHGVFIAESREVVRLLVTGHRFAVRSVLVTETALVALADVWSNLDSRTPIFVAPRPIIESVVGYNVHRGCLAAGERPADMELARLWEDARGLVLLPVLEGVSNPDNVGGIFRNALAFGCPGVVLGPGCADPLYRKAIRVSVGATLRLPFVVSESWPRTLAELAGAGFTLVALTPERKATRLDAVSAGSLPTHRVALLMGSEGDGLSHETLDTVRRHVRIEIATGVDSLNVATTSGIALHSFKRLLGGA